MIKLLGFLDILCMVFLILVWVGALSYLFLVGCAFYLIIKSWVFFLSSKDVSSVLDFLVGVYFLVFVLWNHYLVSLFVLVWLGQKAFFSFL